MSISNAKIRLIHYAKRELGLTEEDYRAILWQRGGVESSKQLDNVGFDLVMERFAELGFKSKSPRKPLPHRAGMATPPQVQIIRHLWNEFTAGEGDDKSLSKWIEGRFKVSSINFVDFETARKVIAALKSMTARKAAKAAAPSVA